MAQHEIITCFKNNEVTEDASRNLINAMSSINDNKTDEGPCIKGRFTENFINKQGNTMLWYAVYHHNNEVVKHLLKNKENYEFKEATSSLYMYIRFSENTAIMLLSCKTKMITDIFTKDKPEKLKDAMDRQLIFMRTKLSFCEGIRNVILDHTNYYGNYAFFKTFEQKQWYEYQENTPLNQALFDNNEELVELLLENGADPNINIANDTVNGLVYALFHGNYKLVALLMRYGAKIYDKYILIAKRMQMISSRETSYSYMPIFCDCKTHDFNKTKEIFEYCVFIKRKTCIVALSREFDKNSLFHADYLCNDLFKLIMNNVMIPNDENLVIREERSWGSWLRSLIRF